MSSPRRRGSRTDKKDWIPASAGMTKKREAGMTIMVSSPRRRGSRKYNASGFPHAQE
ncbi:MAG: hypothetical protein SFT93_03955 [Rickettsiaceae bacterium]|nr:hypothetical protein [Rickettsiaceae bacterium]